MALVAAGLPYRLSLVVASLAGIVAGMAIETGAGGGDDAPGSPSSALRSSTFLLRASFIVFADPHRFPHRFRQALAFVPPAVLAAIVVPGLLMPDGAIDFTLANPRWIAGVIAIVVARAAAATPLAAIASGDGGPVAPAVGNGVKLSLFARPFRPSEHESHQWANSS